MHNNRAVASHRMALTMDPAACQHSRDSILSFAIKTLGSVGKDLKSFDLKS